MEKECGSDVSSRSFWGERCVMAQKTAAKETTVARVEWYYEAEYLNKMFYTFLLHLLQPWHLLLQSI